MQLCCAGLHFNSVFIQSFWGNYGKKVLDQGQLRLTPSCNSVEEFTKFFKKYVTVNGTASSATTGTLLYFMFSYRSGYTANITTEHSQKQANDFACWISSILMTLMWSAQTLQGRDQIVSLKSHSRRGCLCWTWCYISWSAVPFHCKRMYLISASTQVCLLCQFIFPQVVHYSVILWAR